MTLSKADLTTLRITLPPDFDSTPALAIALLRGLLASARPTAFEVIGTGGKVSIQLAVDAGEVERVMQLVLGYAPAITVSIGDDLLTAAWQGPGASFIVNFGLANEFFLPIATTTSFAVDPLTALVGALACAGRGEAVVLQVLLGRTQNPWGKTIRSALVDDEGDDIFLDAPEFTMLAKEKTAQPIAAVVLRVGAHARSGERVQTLLRGTLGFIRQFEHGGGNHFIPLEEAVQDVDQAIEAFLGRKSYRAGMLLSVEEVAQLVHLPGKSVTDPALVRERRRTKQLPDVACTGGIALGMNSHRDEVRTVRLSDESRLAHMHVIGASGTGKSTLLLSLLAQDVKRGNGLLLLDPHGDLADAVLARVPPERVADVCLIDPSDQEFAVTFNPLAADSDIAKQLLASDLVAIFARLSTSWGDGMSTVLANAVALVLGHPKGGTLLDLRRLLLDDAFRGNWLALIADPDLRFFWERQYPLIGARSLGPILTRLDQFLRQKLVRDIVAGSGSPISLAHMIAERRIVIAKLSQGLIGKENAYLLGSLLLSSLHHAALARQALPPSERHPFFCYADECQHFVTDTMASLLTESRKYAVGFLLAHQTQAQLASCPEVAAALLGNAYTRIVFRVGDDDAKTLARGFSVFEAPDLTALPRGEAITRMGGSGNDCNLRVVPLPEIDADVREETIANVRAVSNQRWASPRVPTPPSVGHPVEPAQIEEKGAGLGESRSETPVALHPLQGTPKGAPVEVHSPSRAKPLPTAEHSTPGRGGKEHKYLQHLVKRLAEERGFHATIEGEAAHGRADIVLVSDALTVGCEISITTDPAHELANLTKCLDAGFTRVLFIAKEAKQRTRVAALIAKELPGAPIEVIGPEEIVTALDALPPPPSPPAESIVRGYKVKVTRQTLSPEEVLARRRQVAAVIAKGLQRE